MKRAFTFFILTMSLSVLAGEISEKNFSLAGNYQYLGDSSDMNGAVEVVYFPSAHRNHTGSGYQNYEQPPKEWYAKLPQNTLVKIVDLGDHLEIEHTALFGAYNPRQLGGTITSQVDLKPIDHGEKVMVDNETQTITFRYHQGTFINHVTKVTRVEVLNNGDLKVKDRTYGFDWFPFPGRFNHTEEYTLRKID